MFNQLCKLAWQLECINQVDAKKKKNDDVVVSQLTQLNEQQQQQQQKIKNRID